MTRFIIPPTPGDPNNVEDWNLFQLFHQAMEFFQACAEMTSEAIAEGEDCSAPEIIDLVSQWGMSDEAVLACWTTIKCTSKVLDKQPIIQAAFAEIEAAKKAAAPAMLTPRFSRN